MTDGMGSSEWQNTPRSVGRCTELSPINEWQCNGRNGHTTPVHRARDPKAPPLEVVGCIVTESQHHAAVEEWPVDD